MFGIREVWIGKSYVLDLEKSWQLEYFLIECRTAKIKLITAAYQNKDKCRKETIRTQSTSNQIEVRENASDQVKIGFNLHVIG